MDLPFCWKDIVGWSWDAGLRESPNKSKRQTISDRCAQFQSASRFGLDEAGRQQYHLVHGTRHAAPSGCVAIAGGPLVAVQRRSTPDR